MRPVLQRALLQLPASVTCSRLKEVRTQTVFRRRFRIRSPEAGTSYGKDKLPRMQSSPGIRMIILVYW